MEYNNTKKDEKDTNINHNITIPIHTTEGGRISDDDDSEELDDRGKSLFNKKGNAPMFLFKVKKLGKKGFTHKSRLLFITKDQISYYQMVDKKESNQKFLNKLNSIYRVIKNNNYDEEVYKEMLDAFMALPQEEKILKGSFKNYDVIKIDEIGSFNKEPIKVINLDVKTEQAKEDPNNYWIMEAGYNFARDTILKAKNIIEKYYEDKSSRISIEKNEGEISTKIMTNNINKRLEENLDFEKGTKVLINNKDTFTDIQRGKKSKNRIVLSEEKDKIHYIGIFFQGFVKEYFEHIYKEKKIEMRHMEYEEQKKELDEKIRIEKEKYIKIENIKNIKKKLYLELAIYFCYNQFVKHCEKVVMKIISDLGTFLTNRDIVKPGKLHPIIFPNPFSLTQENNAVLLYSIWGVNYTLTWNSLKGKFNGILTNSHGKWKGLKKSYKQKNCFQDLLTKLSTVCSNINQFPSIPLNCLIDYKGYRVFCESDIFADEEYLKGLELVQEEKTDFIRKLTKYISENNGYIEKNYQRQNGFCNISNRIIASEKALDFEDSLDNIFEDFQRSFPSGKPGEINKDLKFYKTEEKMINLAKNLISDSNIIEESGETFEVYFAESKRKQIEYEFFYILNFDISIPITKKEICLDNKKGNIFYRQEIFINNINLDKYQKEENEEKYDNSSSGLDVNEPNDQLSEGYDDEEINELNSENKNQLLASEEEGENQEELKISENRFLEIIQKNTIQNTPTIEEELYLRFKINFESLLMALDSLYLIPYNSETLKICFHYYGINLYYLGAIAEKTTVPHIRELCLIDMFARVSKKIIFDLLAQKSFENATDAFYSKVKKIRGNKYLIPFSFKENYGGDYLTMSTLPLEDVKFLFYDGIELKGLYLQNDEYPFKDIDDENPRNSRELNEEMFDGIYGNKKDNVVDFFNLLMGNTVGNNIKLILYDKEINSTKELWDFIINEIRIQYNIKDEDVFIYCNLDSLPNYPLISAIQYHTGIKFKNEQGNLYEKVGNQKYSRTRFEEYFLLPKVSYNNFSYFLCKKKVILPLANNFGMHYPGRRIYYQAKLNYHAEQYLFRKKISQNFFYLYYLKILKGWDTYDTKKLSGGGGSSHNTKKEFIKNMAINDISQDQFRSTFEDNFDAFIILMLSQYQPKYQKGLKKLNQSLNKIDNNNLINACENIISIFWKKNHPFMCLLYSTYAKALYKNTNSRQKEDNIELYFFKATEIARNSLGELNIFYGKLTRDIGLFFEKNLKFKEAHKMFLCSYKVFNKHKNRFRKEYFYSLKHLTKNCVNLGQLKDGLNYGVQLVEEIVKELPTLIDLTNNGEDISKFVKGEEIKEEYIKQKYEYYFWNQLHNMDGFTFNLVKIAKLLGEYDTGVKLGNMLFKIISKFSESPVDYTFKNYKNWLKFSNERISDLNRIKSKQNNNNNEFQSKNEIKVKDYGAIKEKTIDNFIKLYLKCLFKSLKGIENKVLARAYVSFIENCNEPSLDNASKNQIDEMFYKLFFRDNGETFEEHFKNKILYFLLKKYKVENMTSVEIQKSYLTSKKELEIMYYKFPKEECTLFDM